MLWILLVVLLLLALGGGYWGSPTYGPYSWSPLGLLVAVALILVLLWAFGVFGPH